MSTCDIHPSSNARSGQSAEGAEFIERLHEAPHTFDFYQAVRRLEALFGRQNYPRIGFSRSRSGDPFHFGQRPFLEFAPRTIAAYSQEPLPECSFPRPSFLVFFFGLFGPNGALPLHLTEHALRLQHDGDYAFTSFVNGLQHRFLSFFYRAWAATRITADLDQPARQRFGTYVGGFLGLGSDATRGRGREFDLREAHDGTARPDDALGSPDGGSTPALDPVLARLSRDWPKLFFAGRLAAQTRNAEGLESILGEYFGVPAEVQSFFGRWYDLPEDDRCRLGLSRNSGSLGRDAVVGARVWDCQTSFRIRLGPMPLGIYQGLLPGNRGFERLKAWVLEYVGLELSWDVQLILSKEAVPSTSLGRAGRLGWTTFLPGGREVDRDECVLDPSQRLKQSMARPGETSGATRGPSRARPAEINQESGL